MEAGIKAKDVADGYRFKIISAADTELVLQSAINYQGNPITITYTLTASINYTALAGTVIPNTANLAWTSLCFECSPCR